MRELIIDAFAGGGGASTGIEMALGRSPDIAINHDPDAIAMHAANHPATLHMMSDVWSVDPEAVCEGRPVGLLWASPDCKHFSKAKGGAAPIGIVAAHISRQFGASIGADADEPLGTVSPVMAHALVAANYVADQIAKSGRRPPRAPGQWNAGPLFVGAGVIAEAAE